MPLLRWAALMSTGTFKLLAIWSFLFSCPARAFFVLGVVSIVAMALIIIIIVGTGIKTNLC